MKYEDTIDEKREKKVTLANVISMMFVILFPWFIGMFVIFDYFLKWNN